MKLIAQLGLTLARFSVSGWVMAATLFVAILVAQAISQKFDSIILDQVTAIRFPIYYGFGFSLLIVSLIGTALAIVGKILPKIRGLAIIVLLAIALILMTVDYYTIFLPLLDLITPPGKARTAEFQSYHDASELINKMGLMISLMAALVLCWGQSQTENAAD